MLGAGDGGQTALTSSAGGRGEVTLQAAVGALLGFGSRGHRGHWGYVLFGTVGGLR